MKEAPKEVLTKARECDLCKDPNCFFRKYRCCKATFDEQVKWKIDNGFKVLPASMK